MGFARGLFFFYLFLISAPAVIRAAEPGYPISFIEEASTDQSKLVRLAVILEQFNRSPAEYRSAEFRKYALKTLHASFPIRWLTALTNESLIEIRKSLMTLEKYTKSQELDSLGRARLLFNYQLRGLHGQHGDRVKLLLTLDQIRALKIENSSIEGWEGVCAGLDYVTMRLLASARFNPHIPKMRNEDPARLLERAVEDQTTFEIPGYDSLASFLKEMDLSFKNDPNNPLRRAVVSAQKWQGLHTKWLARKAYQGVDEGGEYAGHYFPKHRIESLTREISEMLEAGLPSHVFLFHSKSSGGHQATIVGSQLTKQGLIKSFLLYDSNNPTVLTPITIEGDKLMTLAHDGQYLRRISFETYNGAARRGYLNAFKPAEIVFN